LPDAFWAEGNISKDYYFHVKDSSLSKSSYTWDFGDSSTGTTGYDVSHVFPQNKKYTVKLRASLKTKLIAIFG
jgi:PKD repeat protein